MPLAEEASTGKTGNIEPLALSFSFRYLPETTALFSPSSSASAAGSIAAISIGTVHSTK
jgi:hypothetical protein